MATDQSTVTYKDIPGFPGYRAGDDGTIWSCWRATGYGGGQAISDHWKLRKVYTTPQNRLTVTVRTGGGWKPRFVHHLVLEAFIGPRPDGMEACHHDGNPTNNVLSNLRWDTTKANADDTRRLGVLKGVKNPRAKLTTEQVVTIRERHAKGESSASLARCFGVRRQTTHGIIHGKTWQHVPTPGVS